MVPYGSCPIARAFWPLWGLMHCGWYSMLPSGRCLVAAVFLSLPRLRQRRRPILFIRILRQRRRQRLLLLFLPLATTPTATATTTTKSEGVPWPMCFRMHSKLPSLLQLDVTCVQCKSKRVKGKGSGSGSGSVDLHTIHIQNTYNKQTIRVQYQQPFHFSLRTQMTFQTTLCLIGPQ